MHDKYMRAVAKSHGAWLECAAGLSSRAVGGERRRHCIVLSPLDWMLGLFSLDIGIDLGTANTLVSVRGKGIVINEPSYAAIEKKTRRPITYGQEAKEMGGKAPSHILVVRPLRDGVISEFEITEGMLH